ncbi:MAG TPA: 2-phosphosulfolactate phosphatase [Nakamurella sp.]
MTVSSPRKQAPATIDPYSQNGFGVRFEWGWHGAAAIAAGADAVIVIDVLSFTTTLSVAADAGIEVFPFRVRDASAAAFAATRGAMLAVGRREAGETGISLSPLSVRRAVAEGALTSASKLVLPSPNGATIARQLAETGVPVIGASLRNATACANWVVKAVRGPVGVVAAGEWWPGEALRPCVEDLWGAGLVIDALAAAGAGPMSPEASAARAAYRGVGRNLAMGLAACASGLELANDGYGDEIVVAAEVDASRTVPVLAGESFRAA